MNDPNQKYYLFTYYATLAVVGLMAGCLGPSLQALGAQTGQTLQGVSLILATRPAGYLLGTLISGRMLDRVPGHPLLLAALVLAGLSLAATPWVPQLWILALVVFAMGLADGILDVGSNTLLGWVYGARLGPYLNGMHFLFALGALSAPLMIGRALLVQGGLHWAYGLMGLCVLPVAWSLKRLPSPRPARLAEASEPQSPPTRGLVANLLLIFFLYGACEASFGGWISSYAFARGLADAEGAAYLTSLFWGCFGLGRLLAIALALHRTQRWMLGLDAAGMIASLGLMLLFPASKSALYMGSAGAGFFMASFFPTFLAYASGRLSGSGSASGSLVGLFFLGSCSGSIILPWLIGQGFVSQGPWVAMAWILGAALALALLLAALFRPGGQSASAPTA